MSEAPQPTLAEADPHSGGSVTTHEDALSSRALALHAALFLGGAAALAYETAWARMLHRVFGVGDQAVATVLATFFLGLGLGSALGGRIASRLERPARAYAAFEAAIGVWALLSIVLVPEVHRAYATLGRSLGLPALTALRLALSMAILLPPTVLMGATLPVALSVVRRGSQPWAGMATRLYAVNTLGAVAGAGVTGFYALPSVGASASVGLAAGGSFLACALVILALGPARTAKASGASAGGLPSSRTAHLPVALAFSAGFAALASEVLWTRVLRTIVQGTTQAFAAMLVSYLLGIALGSFVAPRAAARRPPLRALGGFQLAAAALTFVGIASAPQLVRLLVLIHGEPEVVPHDPKVLLFASSLLLLPLGLALGTSVPLVFGSASDDPREAGASAGRILAANTLGGLVGALVAGFVLVPLPRFGGLERSLYFVAVVHVAIATVALSASARGAFGRLASALGPAALLAVALAARPSLELPFLLDAWFDPADAAIAGPTGLDEPPLFLEEGRSTTVTVLRRDRTLRLFNDGRPESGLTYDEPGFGPELVLLGGLPSLFAERTDRVLMVGLGGAHSTTMLRAGPFRRIDVVELEAAVARAARAMYELRNGEAERPLPFPLDDDRVNFVVGDARAQLAFAAPGTYDAVVSQPSHPWLAGASALFTREFFLEAKRALREGGVLCQWINVFRMDEAGLAAVLATLRSVFPHAIAFMAEDSSLVVLASDRPLRFDERIDRRLDESPELRRYFGPYRLDGRTELLAALELDDEGLAAFARGGEVLVDDRPALEDRLSRIPHRQAMSYGELDEGFADVPWLSRSSVAGLPPELVAEAMDLRLERLEARPTGIRRIESSLPLVRDASARDFARGLVAEARGDVDAALASYDASTDVEAAYRADALRLAEGRDDELVRVGLARKALPSDATPLLEAALTLGDTTVTAHVLAKIGDTWATEAVREVARRYAAGGCEPLLAQARLLDPRLLEPRVLGRAERCASELGRVAEAAAWAERVALVRQAEAARESRLGTRAADGGNDAAAIPHFRRALRAVPGHRGSVTRLVELLAQAGDLEGAQRALDEGRWAARYLPAGLERELVDLGRNLGLRVDAGAAAAPPDSAVLP